MKEKKKQQKIPYKKIWQYMMPFVAQYTWWVVAVIFVTITGVFIATTVVPIIFKQMIDVATHASDPMSVAKQLFWLVGFLFLARFLRSLFGTLEDVIDSRYTPHVMRLLNNDVFSRLLQHSYMFYANNFTGSLVAKGRRYVRAFRTLMDTITYHGLRLVVELVGVIVTLFVVNGFIAWIFVVWVIIYLITSLALLRYRIALNLIHSAQDSLVTARLADVITNILNVKVFSSEYYEESNYAKVTENEQKAFSHILRFGAVQTAVQSGLSMVIIVIAVYISVRFWLQGVMTVGDIALVQTFAIGISSAMWEVGRIFSRLTEALSDATEMVEIFETPADVVDTDHPEKSIITKGAISFQDVTFSYQDGEEVFENFCLDIQPGERVGLVGHSGGGKTTVTKMILRFHDIDSGQILIDGQNITKITQNDLRKAISYVPQEPLLFHRSVFDNIHYARKDATREQVIDAAKRAFAHDFIQELPNGYDTLVGERGVKLSGGQRQRIAIARVFLEQAPILILDEATSSLDSVSEKHIQDAFHDMTQDKTTIVIAHRLSTVQSLDRIIVLEKGVIVEEGTHNELMEKGGHYATLWEHQQHLV